ncbi:AP-3 complex subunit beta-1 [Cricetulus griseus]|nr:AP-3 complex subunit beta-1 [Cricetulus griseus]
MVFFRQDLKEGKPAHYTLSSTSSEVFPNRQLDFFISFIVSGISYQSVECCSVNPVSTPVALPTPALSPSLIADLEGLNLSTSSSVINVSTPVFVPTKTHELLHRMSGKGLAAWYCFPRQPCIFGDKMVSVQITLKNTSDRKIENIHIGEKKLPVGMQMHVFHPIDSLEPEGSVTVSVGIDFCDSTQTACFQLCTKDDCFNVNIQPPVGELLLPVAMSEKDFKKERGMLTGMNETSATVIAAPQNFTPSMILQKVVNVANLGAVPSGQDNVHSILLKDAQTTSTFYNNLVTSYDAFYNC